MVESKMSHNRISGSNTHIGVSYVFSRSLPFKFARMKVCPSAGMRYKDAKSASNEKPSEACKAGSGGAGSTNGRRRNQNAVGSSAYGITFGSRRGRKAVSCVILLPTDKAVELVETRVIQDS